VTVAPGTCGDALQPATGAASNSATTSVHTHLNRRASPLRIGEAYKYQQFSNKYLKSYINFLQICVDFPQGDDFRLTGKPSGRTRVVTTG
jgi:hypothetical protein